jgi:hypothetical protein
MEPHDQKRLSDILAQLSSPFDGVKLAAVAALERFLAQRGLNLRDLGDAAVRGFAVAPDASKPEATCTTARDILAGLGKGAKFLMPSDERYEVLTRLCAEYLTLHGTLLTLNLQQRDFLGNVAKYTEQPISIAQLGFAVDVEAMVIRARKRRTAA